MRVNFLTGTVRQSLKLLKQMPQISFTQFCNKLSRVLGTQQHVPAKASVKTMTAISTETKSEGEGAVVKSHSKNIKKDKGTPY